MGPIFTEEQEKSSLYGGIISYPALQIAMPEVAAPSSSWVDFSLQPDSRAALFRL